MEIMEADPEDTFFIPAFKELLRLIINVDWSKLKLIPEQLAKIVKFELVVVEE